MSKKFERVAISYEATEFGGDFGMSFAAGLQANACEVVWTKRNEPFPTGIDLLLAYGPFTRQSSMLPTARRLAALPRAARPRLAWWLTEGIPDPRLPTPFVHALARARLQLDERLSTPLQKNKSMRWLTAGHRLRVFGELCWLRDHQVLDVLAVTSASRARYLNARGFNAIVVPLGYAAASYGKSLNLTRDIDVGFLGNLRAPRRAKILERVVNELNERGISVTVQNDLYGEQRTEFLNRTRVLLNILRAPQDFVGQRFLLAGANKTLIVSEPMADSAPFENGKHLVVAPIPQLAERVAYYLQNENARAALAENAYQLTTHELAIEKMVARILQHARGETSCPNI